jgi:hypothetical protein
MAAMQDRNKAYKLKGDVQIDDAYLGGERKGTPGRGAAGKTPAPSFVIPAKRSARRDRKRT